MAILEDVHRDASVYTGTAGRSRNPKGILKKKWQITYIAPLQPPTLAAFRPWGGSAGAGRVRPAKCKGRENLNAKSAPGG